MGENEPTVTRWKRYGKDRLYVALPDGREMGWWDLETDEGHPAAPEDGERVRVAVDVWRMAHGETVTVEVADTVTIAATEVVASEPTVQEDLWLDLAFNSAGAGVRRQALVLRDQAPVRTFVDRVLDRHTDERAWRLGADGEAKVAEQLRRVSRKDPRWRVVHSVPVGARGADIDHVVIGPGGVFTINSKNHPRAKIWVGGDTVLVNGHRQTYVRNSRHEAGRARRLLCTASQLDVTVNGLVVVVDADEFTVKQQPEDVQVLPRRRLAKWLLALPAVIDDDTSAALFDVARRSTTWQPATRPRGATRTAAGQA